MQKNRNEFKTETRSSFHFFVTRSLLLPCSERKNGFTVGEMLMVLLIVILLTTISLPVQNPESLTLFMKTVMAKTISVQEKSFAEKQETEIRFESTKAVFDQTVYRYPEAVFCEEKVFSFNEKGNIRKGGTLRCQKKGTVQKLIFQIGTGRVRHEKE